MNVEFYNNRFTLLGTDLDGLEIPFSFDRFEGDTLQEQALKVKQHELYNDEFYSGHLIVNNKEAITRILDLGSPIQSLIGNKLDTNTAYFTDIKHHGVDSKCLVNEDIILCSSWVLPIIAENYRTDNSLYGDLFVHRIRMRKFNVITELV